MTDKILVISHAVLPENGEDSFALRRDEQSIFLCVADGCGGLGSRRYPDLGDHTGAYAASRLAAHALSKWAPGKRVPLTTQAGESMCRELETELDRLFLAFADEKCQTAGIRIVGSMQRRLPTTLCAALLEEDSACFLWAGDSRSCILNAQGLHQCTQDHVRGVADPFENLYRDMPLSAYLCADTPAKLSFRRVSLKSSGAMILATDGAYNALPTPMEFEMLLMDALKAAKSWESWERRLQSAISKIAQDDATCIICPYGVQDFAAFRQLVLPRREELQKLFITPVRRKKGNIDFARERWQLYRQTYDWTEEERHG